MNQKEQVCPALGCDLLIGDSGAQGLCSAHYQQKRRGITRLMMKPDPPRFIPPPADPFCVGEHELFDSVDPEDHDLARAICAQCPALVWCSERAADLRRDHAWCQPLTGTWAGRLYGRSGVVRSVIEKPVEPDFTDVELRALHAAYQRGERNDKTEMGERIYARKRQARRRAAARLAVVA